MGIEQEIEARGLVADKTAELSEIFSKQRTIYFGIDPTADSAQVGNLAIILLMKRLANAGHKLIFLVGGATGMIGDPKEKGERSLLDVDTLAINTRALKRQFKSILGSNTKFTMVDNADWLTKIKLIPFLRDVGKLFTVNDLIKRDVIRKRLEAPNESISYTEFTYPLLQGYDFLVLNQEYNCDVQVAGSDQWTNAISGVDLIRREKSKKVFVLTAPLVTDSSGKKFGKSEGNAVWLDPKKTSPFAFYQFWINQPDEMVETYLKFYTFLSIKEIDELMTLHNKDRSSRLAQTTLAQHVTEIVHKEKSARAVAEASKVLFGGMSLASLSNDARAVILTEAPTLNVSIGDSLVDTLTKSRLTSSKSEARRLTEGNGISLNDVIVEVGSQLRKENFSNGLALLKKGKRDILILILK